MTPSIMMTRVWLPTRPSSQSARRRGPAKKMAATSVIEAQAVTQRARELISFIFLADRDV